MIDLDVWKINKTDFQIECRNVQLVIIMNPKKLLQIINSKNHDNVTLVEYISLVCETIFSIFLFLEVNILYK